MKSKTKLWNMPVLLSAVIIASFHTTLATADPKKEVTNLDFGKTVEIKLEQQAELLFGFKKPIKASASTATAIIRKKQQPAKQQLLLAKGLHVEYLTRTAANKTDMMAFWPTAKEASHLISCVEGKRETISSEKLNPSVQRINLKTGEVNTILRGMNRCDGIRVTPWGTVLVTEESSDGGAYELLTPLTLNNEHIIKRATGEVSNPLKIQKRTALPLLAWEGLTILNSGVIYNGDELRPGSKGLADSDGGAIYKFIPSKPRLSNTKIKSLDNSPLVAGEVFAMQISCKKPGLQWGQGCEVGNGSWVEVHASSARSDASLYGATGYYRPEDMHRDPLYNKQGIRFCWSNTGRESAQHYAEVMCAIDKNPLEIGSTVISNRFIEGDKDFNSFDNLAFQPITGNLYVVEDHIYGDIFACLPDGNDRDIKTDGCIKVLSITDSSAEPTGFIFSADGTTAYLSIQHSNDNFMPKVDDYATDDILKITGFK